MPVLPVIFRALRELLGAASEDDVARALDALTVTTAGTTAIVSRGGGEPLFGGRPPPAAEVVRIEPGVYAHTPTAAARTKLLAAAAAVAPRVEVHVPLVPGGHRGRLAIDLPRRVLRAAGVRAAEPGDRLAGEPVHVFFDDEPLVVEAARGGLRFAGRRGAWVLLERSSAAQPEPAEPFARELLRVLRVMPEAERRRRRDAPERAVSAMRARGRRHYARAPVGRARLRRAIGWVDAVFPGGPNCLRRTLTELALDRGAASETLVFGLDVGKTGHVAFKDAEDRSFDVAFEVPPPSWP